MSKLITVQYEKNNAFEGREYHYLLADDISLNPGDKIFVPVRDTKSKAKVARVNVQESEAVKFADKLKLITAVEYAEDYESGLQHPRNAGDDIF